MATPIDFSCMFRARVAEKLRVAGQIDEDGAQALAEALYEEWADAECEQLGGVSPRAWFKRITGGEASVALLADYARSGMETPELLLDRIDELGSACAAPLEELARAQHAPVQARAQALDALLDIDEAAATRVALEATPRAKESDAFCELCAQILGERADQAARERLLTAYEAAPEFAQTLILEVLSNFPGDERVYRLLTQLLKNRPHMRAFAAKLLGKYGDERAVAPLKAVLEESGLSYFEHMELRNAVEALGGEADGEREFYGDPDYESLRNLE